MANPQVDQFRNLISGLTMLQRGSILIAVLIAGGGIAAIMHYHTENDFRPLYSAMAPEDAASVVQKLKESGVDYRLADNGSVVLVGSAKLAEARLTLASAGLPKSGRIGFELFDKTNFGATELVEHINYQRALEGELERSVMSLAEVIQARVHLTLAKESVFLEQQQPAKASVMVKLRPGAHVSAQNVLAVCHLVASAVQGLSPDAVAVLDMDGNLLSRPRRTGNGDSQQATAESLDARQAIERDLVNKISATLEPLLGANQFRAGASVDCDLTSGDQQEETFQPDRSVMLTSQKSEDVDMRGATGGIPGTASNLPSPPEKSASSGRIGHTTENVTYQTSRVVRHTTIPQGVVRRMSLSVLVGQTFRWEGSGKTKQRVSVPPTPETLKTIKDLVAGITGFNADRGDQLIVETLPFESEMTADAAQFAPTSATKPASRPAWLEVMMDYKDVALVVVGILAVLSIALTIVIRLIPRGAGRGADEPIRLERELEAVAAARGAAMPGARGTGVLQEEMASSRPALIRERPDETGDRIRMLAQRDVAATANVLRMWMDDQKA